MEQIVQGIITRAMFSATPCPDGERGLACPRCMAKEATTQLLIAGTYTLGGDSHDDKAGSVQVAKNSG